MNARHRTAILILLAGLTAPGRAAAGSVTEVEEDLPVSVDSAYPIPFMGREVQSFVRYVHGDEGIDEGQAEVRLEMGILRNTELKAGIPYHFGEAEPDGWRPADVELLYSVNQETLWLPAGSVAAGARSETGSDAHGYDPVAKLLLTKTISGRTTQFQQLHANGAYRWNDEEQTGERDYELTLILGYSRRISSGLLFVSDVLRRWRMEDDHEENLAEAGIRWQVTPLITTSAGAGFGFGDHSPDTRVTAGVQVMF